MTREEAKHLMFVLQGWIEGKTIQKATTNMYGNIIGWEDTAGSTYLNADNPTHLRVKPESQYRPFKSMEECLNEMQKHTPIGWVKHKTGEYCQQITCVTNDGRVYVGDSDTNIDYDTLLEYYTFIDEAQIGVKEE